MPHSDCFNIYFFIQFSITYCFSELNFFVRQLEILDQIVNEGIRLKLKIKRRNYSIFLLPHLIHSSKITRRTTQKLHQSINKQRRNICF